MIKKKNSNIAKITCHIAIYLGRLWLVEIPARIVEYILATPLMSSSEDELGLKLIIIIFLLFIIIKSLFNIKYYLL